MKVIGLDGREYYWKLFKRIGKKNANCSFLHEKARKLLKRLFPLNTIIEEVSLPGSSQTKSLSADFVLVELDLIVEVHGEQHYKFNSFHYYSMADFHQAKKRDRDKIAWAELNDFMLVVLPFNQIDKWEELINGRYDT